MINPIKKYFEWHDSKYLRRTLRPEKNQLDIKVFSFFRIILFLSFFSGYVSLLISLVWTGFLSGSAKFFLVFSVTHLMLFYLWVTEGLLFRKYIEENRKNDKI